MTTDTTTATPDREPEPDGDASTGAESIPSDAEIVARFMEEQEHYAGALKAIDADNDAEYWRLTGNLEARHALQTRLETARQARIDAFREAVDKVGEAFRDFGSALREKLMGLVDPPKDDDDPDQSGDMDGR